MSALFTLIVFFFLGKLLLPIFVALALSMLRGNGMHRVLEHFMRNLQQKSRHQGYYWGQGHGNGWNHNHNQRDGYNQHDNRRANNERRASVSSSNMTMDEAFSVLGLKSSASQIEIKEAYQRLVRKVHPDQGGSEYLTQKLNQAKELLIKR